MFLIFQITVMWWGIIIDGVCVCSSIYQTVITKDYVVTVLHTSQMTIELFSEWPFHFFVLFCFFRACQFRMLVINWWVWLCNTIILTQLEACTFTDLNNHECVFTYVLSVFTGYKNAVIHGSIWTLVHVIIQLVPCRFLARFLGTSFGMLIMRLDFQN